MVGTWWAFSDQDLANPAYIQCGPPPMPKSASKSQQKVHKVMHEYKVGKLHSGSKKGPLVKKRKQAIAIALSESRRRRK
jgi:hypothetical protein